MIRNIELVTLIQTLVAAGQGSFHKAGALLGIPASTVSGRVRNLEILSGASLFARHRHGIRPTAVGEAFLKPLRRILDELNIVLANASTIAQRKTGWLKIGTYVSPSMGHLRAVLSKYRQSFPDVEVQYTDEERRDLMQPLNACANDHATTTHHFRTAAHHFLPLCHSKTHIAT